MRPSSQTLLPAVSLVLFAMSIGCNWEPLQREDRRRVTLATSQARIIGEVVEAFKRDTGIYPDPSEGLDVLVSNSHQHANWRGPYLKYLPLDPWKHPYTYIKNNDGALVICSFGSDGRAGGAGSAADIIVMIRQK